MSQDSRRRSNFPRTREAASPPVDTGRDAYLLWAAEVARLRQEDQRRRRGWRVSVVEKEGQPATTIIRRAGDPRGLEAILGAALRHEGLNATLDGPNWHAWWRAAVDDRTARQTKVASFRNGFLTVAVDNAALRAELETFRRAELLAALQRLAGDAAVVRGIKFKSGGKATRKK